KFPLFKEFLLENKNTFAKKKWEKNWADDRINWQQEKWQKLYKTYQNNEIMIFYTHQGGYNYTFKKMSNKWTKKL
ncbi:hypothetical protein BVX93_01100, partial [bacterium B13(2017)]